MKNQFLYYPELDPLHKSSLWNYWYHGLDRSDRISAYIAGRKNSISNILAEHVFEHLDFQQGVIAINNCYEYLEVGGSIRIAVPDGNFPNEDYIKYVKPNGTGLGAMDHKILYT